MAGDTNTNIHIGIDTSQAMAQLRALEKELTVLNRSMVVGSAAAAKAQSAFAQSLMHNVNATGHWSASTLRMATATEQFASRLDRGKLSLKEYYKYGMASTRSFGKFFGNEFNTVSKLVDSRVKTLQQQYVQLGRDAQGAMQSMVFRPKALNYGNVTTQLMMATQRAQIFNKLMDDGAAKLLNFGKNTQWAGRQLMVGFTIPLMLFASQAIKAFKEIETQVIRFKKVYGDIYTNSEDTAKALKNIQAMADEYTKYGIKVADTIKLAADAAAAGNSGKQLENIVKETTKLAVLGGVTQEKALETTIALQNAFSLKGKDLTQTVDFLNAVENQTVVSLEDFTTAIPKVAPVVEQLGGSVKDLAFFMAAMQEGGISAAQGANALKSGLGSLINPSNKAAQAAAAVGVNIRGIVEANAGNLKNTVIQFAQALKPLTDLQRTRVIEDVFGKYQFARISALLNNVTKEGTQAARVLQLTNASAEELAILSQREMKTQADSQMNKLASAMERLKASMAPIGELFAKVLTPVAEFFKKMFDKFNNLPEGVKKAVAVVTAVIGGIGPILLMTVGLVANGIANLLKLFNLLRKGYQQLAYGSSDVALKTQYLSQEELENASITNALYSRHQALSAAYELEATALAALAAQYRAANTAMSTFSLQNPGMFMPKAVGPKMFADGTTSVPGPQGAGDIVPAMLSPGEAVIPAKQSQKYRGFISQIISDNVPGHFAGRLPIFGAAAALSDAKAESMVLSNAFKPRGPLISLAPSKRGMAQITVDGFTFDFKESALPKFEEKFDAYVKSKVARGVDEATATTEAERYVAERVKRKIAEGKTISTTEIFKMTGSGGGSSRNKMAPTGAKKRFQDAIAVGKLKAVELNREFESEIAFLKNSGLLSADELAIIEKGNGFKADVSHLDPANRNLWDRQYVARDLGLINKTMAYERNKSGFGGAHILTRHDAEQFLAHLNSPLVKLTAQKKAAKIILERRLKNGFYSRHDITDTGLGLSKGIASAPGGLAMLSPGETVVSSATAKQHSSLISSMIAGTVPEHMAGVFLGMPKSYASMLAVRESQAQIEKAMASSTLRDVAPTNFGHLIQPFSGHSYPIHGVGGVYRKPNGDIVVVKPVVDELAARAEMNATKIARDAHGLESPVQSLKTMIDPTDPSGKRKIMVLESPYNPAFATPHGNFTKGQYIRQLVASALRGDKDLQMSNLFGNVLADVGPAGVFGAASGFRKLQPDMLSMEDQARINVLGVKGSRARKFFAEATSDIARSMTPIEFQNAIISEIDTVLPKLKKVISGFNLSKEEQLAYQNMIARLEAGKKADWTQIHALHSKVPYKKYATGVLSVPGPKGAGDIQPAMLSPGEAVIPAKMAEKYAPLISGMINGTIPEHGSGRGGKGGIPKPLPGFDYGGPSVVKPNWRGRLYNLRDTITPKLQAAMDKASKAVASTAANAQKMSIAIKNNTTAIANNANAQRLARVEAIKNADKTRGIRGWLNGYGGVPGDIKDETTGQMRRATAAERTNMRQMKRMNFSQKMMGVGMAAMMVPMVAQGYASKHQGGWVDRNMTNIMMASMLPMILPMFNSPLKLFAASIIGLVALYKMQGAAIKKSIQEGTAQGRNIGMTVSSLEEFGKITGQVSATQIQAEKRKKNALEITPVSQRFGAQFAGSDFGKQFIDNFKKVAGGKGMDAAKILATQLGSATAQGVISNAQAESIIVNIARGMNDTGLELQARAYLREITGPGGEDLTKDPLKVQTKLLLKNSEIQQNLQSIFTEVANKEMGGWLANIGQKTGLTRFLGLGTGISKGEAGQLAAFGVPAAGASLYAGAKAYKGVSTAMGGVDVIKELGGIKEIARLQGITSDLSKFKKVSGVLSGIRAARAAALAGEGAAAVGSGGTAAIPAAAAALVTTTLFTGLEVVARKWQQGNEKKQVGAVAGMAVGQASQNFQAVQAAADAIKEWEDAKLRELSTELSIAKTAEKRLDIEKQMAAVRSQSDQGQKDINIKNQDLFESTDAFIKSITSDEARQKVVDAATVSFNDYFKDKVGPEKQAAQNLDAMLNPDAKVLKTEGLTRGMDAKSIAVAQDTVNKYQTEFDAKLKQGTLDLELQNKLAFAKTVLADVKTRTEKVSLKKEDQQAFNINIKNAITSGAMSAKGVESLINIMNNRGEDYTAGIKLLVSTAGTTEADRLGTILSSLGTQQANNVYVNTKGLDAKALNEFNNGMDEFMKLPPDIAINMGLEVNGKQDISLIKKYGKEITDLKKRFPDGKISKTTLELYQKSIGGEKKNDTLDAAIKNWELLQSFDPSVQLSAVVTLGAFNISDSIDEEVTKEMKNKYLELNPKVKLDTTLGKAAFEAWRKTEAAKTIEVGIKPTIIKEKLTDLYTLSPEQIAALKLQDQQLSNAPKEDKSWIEDLLQQLKLLKESTINAKNGLAELEKWFGAKAGKTINPFLDKQNGAIGQIEAYAKNFKVKGKSRPIALSPELMDLISGLDADQYKFFEKRFLRDKNGKFALNEKFQYVNAGMNKKGIAQFINDQKDANTELSNQNALFDKLTKTGGAYGFSVEKAAWAMQDAAVAAALVKNNELSPDELAAANKEWERRVALKAKEAEIGKQKDISNNADQIKAFSILTKAGVNYMDAIDISKVQEWASQITFLYADADKEGQMTATRAEEIRNKFKQYTTDVKSLRDSVFDLQQISETKTEKTSDKYAAESARLVAESVVAFRSKYGMSMEQYKIATQDIEQKKQVIQDQIDEMNNGLDDIAKKETDINDAYDKKIQLIDDQANALDKVQKINENLANQQKDQLSIATALRSGDIAAAAAAEQQYRANRQQEAAQAAQDALSYRKDLLEKQRTKDLENAQASVNGTLYTRKQLEDAIDAKNADMKPLQKEIDGRNRIVDLWDQALSKAQAGVEINGMTQAEFDALNSAVTALNDAYDKQVINIDEIATAVGSVESKWKAVTAAITAAGIAQLSFADKKPVDSPPPVVEKKQVVDTNNNKHEATAAEIQAFNDASTAYQTALTKLTELQNAKITSMTDSAAAAREKALAAARKAVDDALATKNKASLQAYGTYASGGYVKKFFASGGANHGTDTIPAMLSPGEFVVRKFAVDSFGVENLKAINDGTFSGSSVTNSENNNYSSVYNYSIGINVNGSSLNENDVARAVIAQIRNVDSQRIRGQR